MAEATKDILEILSQREKAVEENSKEYKQNYLMILSQREKGVEENN